MLLILAWLNILAGGAAVVAAIWFAILLLNTAAVFRSAASPLEEQFISGFAGGLIGGVGAALATALFFFTGAVTLLCLRRLLGYIRPPVRETVYDEIGSGPPRSEPRLAAGRG